MKQTRLNVHFRELRNGGPLLMPYLLVTAAFREASSVLGPADGLTVAKRELFHSSPCPRLHKGYPYSYWVVQIYGWYITGGV